MSEGKLRRDKATKYRTNIYNLIKQNLVAYSGFASLIKELIQNSDDSSRGEKVEITIDFRDDMLILRNNTSFTENDWEKIEIIASENKENDPNSTGRFGTGFVSVFKICDDLNIHSEKMSKKFELNTLEWIPYESSRYQDMNITEFEFFWRKKPNDSGNGIDAAALTEDNLLDFQKETIDSIYEGTYFLNNVITIEILENGKLKQKIEIKKKKPENISSSSNEIKKEERIITVTNSDNSKKILPFAIYSQNIDKYFAEEYKCKVARKKPLLLSIAVNKESLKRGRVFCTLPTSDYIECLFDLNCDFWPDNTRKHIIMAKDDSKGKYNLKILNQVPEILLSITEDLKNELPKESFYNLLSSFLIKEETFFGKYAESYLSLLKNSRSNIIFIQGKWFPVNKLKYTEEKYLLPLLSKVNSSVVPQQDLKFLPLFKELGMKEFNLIDLINELKTVPVGIELNKSIFSTKKELKGIFRYLEKKREDVKISKSEINRLNIFLTNKGKLINAEICKFYTVPDELLPLKLDFNLPEIDSDILKEFEYFLSNTLGIFKKFSDFDLVSKILKDFENNSFPLKIEDSVAYMNNKEKLLIVIDFLNLYLGNCIRSKKQGFIRHEGVVYTPSDYQYDYYIKQYYTDFEKLPLILSSNNLLYQWKNNEVFFLNSNSKKRFAERYKIESIDQDILDRIKSYNELKLKNIVDYVKESTKKGEGFEDEFLILLYKLIQEDSSQLYDKDLMNKIRKLLIFTDIEGNLCSLECNDKTTFLKGNYDDKIGVARILDVKLINEIPFFKEDVLKNHFEIRDLTFGIYIKYYFCSIFEDDSLDANKKLELIKELNAYHPKKESNFREEITRILKKTKLIYCNNNQFYYPYDDFIYKYNTSSEKEFASIHGLEVMQNEVEKIANKYNLVKEMKLKNTLEYLIDDLYKDNFVMNEHYLNVLYNLILEKVDELNSEDISTIKKLKIFNDNSGSFIALENKLLKGPYSLPKGIEIKEILDESIISKVPNFKEKVLINIFNLKLLDYETFINRYFKDIFSKNELNKEVKLNVFKELYIHFAELEESDSFQLIKGTLVNSKIVYCQDGEFHYPTCKNLFFKSEMIDEIFGEDYIYPKFEDKYKHLFKELGVKETIEPFQIVDYVRELISDKKIDENLINKIKRLFGSINSHWEKFAQKTEDFAALSNLEWLPASSIHDKLYKPSELYTQNSEKGQNTRPYLENLNDIKYLDVKDSDLKEKDFRRGIKAELLNLLKLNNIDKIPVSKLIDNLECASKINKPLTTQMNSLNIYKLLNSRVDRVEISRLNTFPSFEIKYRDNEKPLYFKPSEVFKKDLQKYFGTEYIGYLSSKFIATCENLLNKLEVLEEPNINTIKNLLEKINKKYELNNLCISSENDIHIIKSCLEHLDKNLIYMGDNYIAELRKLPLFCNRNNRLLSADSCILEDNPILCQQFGDALPDYFIKLNEKYPDLIERLEIQGLNQLVKKDMQTPPDSSKIYKNSNFTERMQNISKLMPRIKAGNQGLDKRKWLKIKPEVTVYTYNDLHVSKYIDWDHKRYYSKFDNVNCYFEVENGDLDRIYVKGPSQEIEKSFAYELFEEIHPNINQNFIATALMLLKFTSYDEMDKNLTDILFYPVLEHADSTVINNRIIDEGTFEETDHQKDYLIDVEETAEKVAIPKRNTVVEKLGILDTPDINIENVDVKATEMDIISRKNTTEEVVTINADTDIDYSNISLTTKEKYNKRAHEELLQSAIGKKPTVKTQEDFPDLKNNIEKKTSHKNKGRKDKISITHCLSSFNDREDNFDPQISDGDEEAVTVGRTTSPTKRTNFRKKLSEKYSGKHSNSLQKDKGLEISRISMLEEDIPRSLEEDEDFNEKTLEEIFSCIEKSNLDNKSRGYSPRLDPNSDDETADAEVRNWYEGKCQICGRTFKKEGSRDHFSEVIKLLDISEQGITHPANKLCLCSYHASALQKGEIYINFHNLVDNKLDITIYDEYENGYRDNNCHIKYDKNHFSQLKKFLAIN